MPYKKSNKQIQDSAFKLKSGNATPFKQLGSSPVKQNKPGGSVGEALDHYDKHKLTKDRGYTGKFNYAKFKKMYDFRKATKDYNRIQKLMFGKGSTYVYSGPGVSSGGVTYEEAMRTRPTKPTFSTATSIATKTSTASKVLNALGKVASKVALPATVAEFMYGAYTSGQKSSGGRYGFKQNPSYDASKTGVKHGDPSSNAMFIPTEGRAYKDMFSIGKPKIINPK